MLIILTTHVYGELKKQDAGPEQSHVNVNTEN